MKIFIIRAALWKNKKWHPSENIFLSSSINNLYVSYASLQSFLNVLLLKKSQSRKHVPSAVASSPIWKIKKRG